MRRLFTTLSITALFVSGSLNVLAQNSRMTNQALPYNGEMCGSAYIHKELMNTDPVYKKNFLANQKQIDEIIANQKAGRYGQNSVMATVYTIPVVVHVIHLGESVGSGTNISDAQIQSAIDNLNTAYRNQSPYNGIDIEVQFALAKRDPNCNSTTGINRVSGAGVSDYSTNGCTRSGTNNEATIKALSKWPNSTYYNIWVVAGIDGNMGGGGVQGYAYFPGAGSSVDGAVMLYNAFGYDPTGSLGYNLKSYTNHNGTAIHELGHAFNLYHTFEGDDANNDGVADQCPSASGCGSGQGDCCSDIPPHQRSNSDCNTSGTNSCDGGSSNSLFVHNFMDYSSDACKYQFTSNQKDRMRAAIYASRGSLINNLATTAPSGSLPASACTSTPVNMGSDYGMGVYGFTFNDLDVNSSGAYGDGGCVDRTCYFQTTVTAGNAYPVTITPGTLNPQNGAVYIDYNNDGAFNETNEKVFTFSNTTAAQTGTITIPGTATTGTKLRMRVFIDFVNYSITSACQTPQYGQYEDYAITISGSAPVANFSGSPTTLCVGNSVTFTDASTNTPTSWSWTFQGGSPATSTSQNPVITYTAAGTYSVSLTATNASGSNTMNKTAYITVNGKPTVTANASANPICSGSSTTLSGGGASTYTWTGGVTNGGSVSPSSTSSYTVTGTDANGCTNTAAITVSVTATPTVNVSGTMTITSGSSTTLTATGGTSYVWTPSTGLSATTGSAVVANPTVTTAYTVTGTTGSCSGTKTFTVTVGAGSAPVANFSGSPTTLCVGSSVAFTDSSTNSPTSWSWTFEGGSPATSTSQNPVVTYTAAGTYSVSLTATNASGSNTMNKTAYVTVNGKPTVTANASANPICSGSSTTLSGSGASTYTWTGGVMNGVAFSPSTTTSYTVTGADANGCTNTAAITVSVNPTPTVNVSGTMTVSYGGSTTLTASGGTSYVWTPSTGLSATTGSVVVANPTVTTAYTVTGTTGSCSGTKAFTVIAYGPTNLQPAYCGITLTAMNQQMACVGVSGSGYYKYEVTNLSTNSVVYYQSPNASTLFQMSWVSGVAYNTTYQIRVAAYINGAWTSYGTSCNVTTPVTAATKLQNAYCGITETALNQQLACDVVYGATNYRYEVTDLTTNSIVYYTSPNASTTFQMSWVSGVAYGRTYGVRVAAYAGGSLLAYGTSCNVTTPPPPTTKLQTAYCGITITAMNQPLACDVMYGATQYKYEITDLSTNAVMYYLSPNSSTAFQMIWVSGVQYAKTYGVRVAYYAGGSLSAYGTSCNVTTPAAPTTQLQASDCNITETSFAQTLHCVAVQAASQYLYEVTDVATNTIYYYQSPANSSTAFQMNWVSGVTVSKTYGVRVAANVGGSWLAYGPSCSITTAASIMTSPGTVSEMETGGFAGRNLVEQNGISLNVYPNPNNGHVYLNVNMDMKIAVTNLLGETIYEGQVKNGVNELYFLDAKPGMYIIRVTDGENAAQVRMIKN